MRLITHPDFFARAGELRQEFDARVGPARTFSPQRLGWDYWHVEGQYSYLRCLARNYFSPSLYRSFLDELRRWGEEHLGSSAFTELWLSYYIDGCRQELHADTGQGPWAIVFSLTRWDQRRFQGGETLLLNSEVLDYWRHFDPGRPLEKAQLFDSIPSLFNQLVVFDGRIPHAVASVEGTRDPIDSRVVLHGWFQSPVPRAGGAQSLSGIAPVVDQLCKTWNAQRAHLGRMHGTLPVRLRVSGTGRVAEASALLSNLISLEGRPSATDEAKTIAIELCGDARFPAASGEGAVLVPFIAEDR